MIDTHCHLDDARYADDGLSAVLLNAQTAGVSAMITSGCDLASSVAAVHLASTHAPIFATVGVHPHEAKHWNSAAAERHVELARSPKVVAYGEIGLDFHYNLSEPDVQRAAFSEQMDLASRLELPVVIHCRDAYDEMLPIVEAFVAGGRAAVMHCWAGTPEQARAYARCGAYLGFGGMVTFKSADTIRQAAEEAPAELLLLETDAPWLAPVPYRGSRNEPCRVADIAQAMARIRGVPVGDLIRMTTANAVRAYPGLAAAPSAGGAAT